MSDISSSAPCLRIIPLGGLGEIGLNMMLIECNDTMIIIDAGIMFPQENMPGIDFVIPDITYVRKNIDKLSAIILTHGHEDHIGALPYILPDLTSAPVYATPLTNALIQEKLRDHHYPVEVRVNIMRQGDRINISDFNIEFIRAGHSIPDGVGLAIETPLGIIIHSGDFKIDQTPIDGNMTDINRFAYYGDKGVLLLMSDSTNVERPGFSISEKEIENTFDNIFRESPGRLVIAMFASNILRIQKIVNIAQKYGRHIIFNGKSMVNNVRIAKELGYLDIPEGLEINISSINKYPDRKILLITTGSQAEPMSALVRIAFGDHKKITVKKGDTVVFSSKFIPGNERTISALINQFYRKGAHVIYEKVSDIHVSGHANQEELKFLINIVKPKFFMPIHGEYRHLVKHYQLAHYTGIPEKNIILAEDGEIVCLSEDKIWKQGTIESGHVFVDGKGVGDIDNVILRDRRNLAEDGLVISIIVINRKTGEIVSGPAIMSRGFIFEEMQSYVIEGAKDITQEVVESMQHTSKTNWPRVQVEIRRQLRRYFNSALKRRPMIFPMIIEI